MGTRNRRAIISASALAALAAALSAAACGSDGAPSTFGGAPASGGGVADDGGAAPSFADGGSTSALFAGCATARGQAERLPVYLLFVVDGSGSMNDDTKWEALVPAYDAFVDDLASRADPTFGAGLTVFADANDPTITDTSAGPYSKMDVPIAFVDALQKSALRGRLDGTSPNLGTPTYEVLSGQFPLLEAYAPPAGSKLATNGRKVLVFVSDGVPDPDMPAGQNEQPWSIDLVRTEAGKGVATFAVGIGKLSPLEPAKYDPRFMAQLAVAGGTAAAGCNPDEVADASRMCHFQITPGGGKSASALQQELSAAIDSIRTQALSCEYPLEHVAGAGAVDPGRVNVVYTDGSGAESVLPESATDGWSYDDPANPHEVILRGATCDRVKADRNGKVDIVLGCETVLK